MVKLTDKVKYKYTAEKTQYSTMRIINHIIKYLNIGFELISKNRKLLSLGEVLKSAAA